MSFKFMNLTIYCQNGLFDVMINVVVSVIVVVGYEIVPIVEDRLVQCHLFQKPKPETQPL